MADSTEASKDAPTPLPAEEPPAPAGGGAPSAAAQAPALPGLFGVPVEPSAEGGGSRVPPPSGAPALRPGAASPPRGDAQTSADAPSPTSAPNASASAPPSAAQTSADAQPGDAHSSANASANASASAPPTAAQTSASAPPTTQNDENAQPGDAHSSKEAPSPSAPPSAAPTAQANASAPHDAAVSPEPGAAPGPVEGSTASPPAPPVAPVVGPRTALLLAVASGLLYFLAFPGIDVWPLALIAFAPIQLALRGRTPKRAALLGWIMGMVMGMCGFYWLLGMLQTFSGFPLPLCLLFMVILVGFQAGITALMGFLYSASERRGWWPGLSFALAFIASETLWPLLFPFAFAATVHQVPALMQLAELGGPKAVALPLLASSWGAAEAWLAWRRRRAGGAPPGRRTWLKITALLAAPVLAALYGAVRIHQVDAAVAQAERFKVGLVQANMGLQEKRLNRAEGLKRHLDLTKKLRKEDKVELVVWSETSVAGAVPEEQADSFYHQTITRRLGVPVIIGGVLVRKVPDARDYVLFNSALLTNKKGHIVGRYDKQFLLAFGEYLPFGETFPVLYDWSPNSGRFTPGKTFEPLRLGKHGIATFICYEDIIPSFVNRIMREGEAHLLVNITNDAWFGDTLEPAQHMALSKMRAVEQRRFFVRSTNSGVSGIVDPVGRMLAESDTFVQAALSAEVAWLSLWTPYRFWGDAPWWLLSFASIGLSLRSRKKS